MRGEPGGSSSTPSCSTLRGMFALFLFKNRKRWNKGPFIWNLFLHFKTRKHASVCVFPHFCVHILKINNKKHLKGSAMECQKINF